MIKRSSLSSALKGIVGDSAPAALTRAAVAAPAGYMFGKHVTPGLMGYEENERAKKTSAVLDAILFGTLGAMSPALIRGLAKAKGPEAAKQYVGLGGALAGSEAVPIAVATMGDVSKGMQSQSQSVQQLAERAKDMKTNPSFSNQMKDILTSRAAKGAGAGAGFAGLTAMGTGLLRGQTEEERRSGTSRAGMVGSDFLKYVIPAMIAGGALGHFSGD